MKWTILLLLGLCAWASAESEEIEIPDDLLEELANISDEDLDILKKIEAEQTVSNLYIYIC